MADEKFLERSTAESLAIIFEEVRRWDHVAEIEVQNRDRPCRMTRALSRESQLDACAGRPVDALDDMFMQPAKQTVIDPGKWEGTE